MRFYQLLEHLGQRVGKTIGAVIFEAAQSFAKNFVFVGSPAQKLIHKGQRSFFPEVPFGLFSAIFAEKKVFFAAADTTGREEEIKQFLEHYGIMI